MIDELLSISIEIRKTFAYLSHYPLPLGLSLGPFLHLFVGIIWTGLFHTLKKSKSYMLVGIFLIAISKEVYDSFTLENRMDDHLIDIIITVAPSILWILYLRVRTKWTS